MRRIGQFAVACLLAGAVALPAVGQKTRYWRQSSYDDFEKGTAKGVALRSDGRLLLAPRFERFADPNLAYLWALRADSKGRLYAAGGSNARVLRMESGSKPYAVFESQELAAQALAIDATDNLYVGTSPDGKIYKVTPRGERAVFFEPNTKYIWDLEIDAAGTLYVATGDKGEVFAVTPDGKGEVFFKSDETHIRALAFDAKGNLIAGTDPSGMIVRLEKTASGVQAFVVYETARKEVTSLVADGSGYLYGAAIGQKSPGTKTQSQLQQQALIQQAAQAAAVAAQAAAAAQQTGSRTPVSVPPATQFAPFVPTSGGSEVYRIGPDGAPEVLWSSHDTLVYSLGIGPRGRLLVGTGNDGKVIEIEGNNLFANLAKTASDQVTGVLPGPGGAVYLCTANPGQVFKLGPGYETEGSFEAEPFDAKGFSQWGRLTWWGENESTRGQVQFFVRTGNTSNPEQNWSPWSGPLSAPDGDTLQLPPARFAQWKAVFKAPARDGDGTPSIGWVSLAYLQKNSAPVVDAIAVQDPGVRAQAPGGNPSSMNSMQPIQLRLPQALPGQQSMTQRSVSAPRFEAPPQAFAQRGYQTVLWAAQDDNDDELRYSVYYRGEDETNWKLLAKDLEQKYHTWETTTMPDGAYYLRVVASDALSNPSGEGLVGERTSDRFEVDNTPPAVQGLHAAAMSPEIRVQFVAADSYSAIARAEYSVDAGDWVLVMPQGRVSDSPKESYDVVLRGLAPGEHTLAVRVFDQFDNSTSAKVTFTVGGKK